MTGPYIVTTSRPAQSSEWFRTSRGSTHIVPASVSRIAAATLDRARDKAWLALAGQPRHFLDQAHEIPESGGTITPPDGTVIEVEPTTWDWLSTQVPDEAKPHRRGKVTLITEGELIDAFNAQETKR